MDRDKVTSASWAKNPINYKSITPLDGRNYHKIAQLSEYFSEAAINRARVQVEVEYLITLSGNGIGQPLNFEAAEKLRELYREFDIRSMVAIKKWEEKTNHDVKAVEYFLKDKLKSWKMDRYEELIHWGLTTNDVNNLAINLNLKNYIQNEQMPIIKDTVDRLVSLVGVSDYIMLGRTHGQPAGVTTMAKELAVFVDRLVDEYKVLKSLKINGKLTGVVGTLADHKLLNGVNWLELSETFVTALGLKPTTATTQILPYDNVIRVFDSISRLQNIALDLVQNLWWYVSKDFFVQAKKENEVGSSTLPHKVNPIYLEGAEGGFEIANSLLSMYKTKLSKSRLQRDLSDSTVRRSMGVAFGYSYLSWQSLVEALGRLVPNGKVMADELNAHWEIVTGPAQNWLKLKGYKKPYETLMAMTRGKQLSQSEFKKVIKSLNLKPDDGKFLANINFDMLRGEVDAIVAKVIKKTRRVFGYKRPLAVVGMQWGDEGKGKLIDYLGKLYDTTVRYNGGHNAGHTVKVGKTTLHMSLIPSAVLHHKKVMISQAVVIFPPVLVKELTMLTKLGVKPKLSIDPRCHVVLPYHQQMDAASEWYKGKKKQTGSLKLGIGFTYEDRTNRAGLRMMDLVNPKRMEQVIRNEWELKKLRVTRAYGAQFDANLKKTLKDYKQFGRVLKPYVADVSSYVRENIEHENFLLESAQGTYLDFVFGSYPYTVAYHTLAPSALADIGMPARKIDVMGIVKAYTTRVGNGPFLAEQDNKVGQHLRDKGHEYGTVSGRPRRCGWLDLPMINNAINLNGVTSIALTKLDVLSGLSKINLVMGYMKGGKKVYSPPADDFEATGMKPVYKEFKGWKKDISKIENFDDLPVEAKAYITHIEKDLLVPIDYVSVGPDRAQTIMRHLNK